MNQSRFGPRLTQGVKMLIMINGVSFLLMWSINLVLSQSHSLMQNHIAMVFSLTPQLVLEGFFWQLFTYQFLHGGLLHFLVNMFTLWMIGPELEQKWSTRFFIKYYFICATGAGLFIFTMPIILDQSLIIPTLGASGAIFGLLLAYAVYWPNRMILIWFIIPVKVKYFVIIIGFISLLLTFQSSGAGGISHIGHMGGLITGYIYLMYKIPQLIEGSFKIDNTKRRPRADALKKILVKYQEYKKKKKWLSQQENIHDEMHMEEKVDELLEKISKRGWKALSAKEKDFLKKASKRMDKE